MIRTLAEYFNRSVDTHPEKIALHFGKRSYTYRDFDRVTRVLVQCLQANGVSRQDRIVICLGNVPETLWLFWAALRMGACASVIAPDQGTDKIRFIVGDAEPKVLVCSVELATELHAVDSPERAYGSLPIAATTRSEHLFRTGLIASRSGWHGR
jgi:acyl-coenzyme A synthetase/AMP-(fatty) acid ligase